MLRQSHLAAVAVFGSPMDVRRVFRLLSGAQAGFPRGTMRFAKYHALGNDYLVLPAVAAPTELTAQWVERVCHRHFGLGSDGILLGPLPRPDADFGLRIFNPDGSEAEKSGNGLRIFARFLFDEGRVAAGQPFSIHTPGGVVKCQVERPDLIHIEMGRASFHSDVVPVRLAGPPREVVLEPITVGGETLKFTAVTVGNPHCVVPVEEPSPALAQRLGPLLETHPLFPNRTNVQFLKVLDRNRIQIEIWERGAGYTLASGSSSCAAAAAAYRLGWVDRDVTVVMPGGTLALEIGPGFALKMSGPTTRVGDYTLHPEATAGM